MQVTCSSIQFADTKLKSCTLLCDGCLDSDEHDYFIGLDSDEDYENGILLTLIISYIILLNLCKTYLPVFNKSLADVKILH